MPRSTMALVLLLAIVSAPAAGCGPDSDCVLGDRSYRIRVPEAVPPGQRVGAIFFAHGFRGRAADVMADAELGRVVSGLGLALIAPQSADIGWASHGSPFFAATGGVGEIPYLERVVADASGRFPIDHERILAAGISAGGMLVWTVACYRGELFAGFLSFAGTLWAPQPATCPSRPLMLRHVHARADPVVPLEGGPAPIAGFRLGNVFEAMEVMARSGGFGPPTMQRLGELDCQVRRDRRGAELALCLHDGGHDYRVEDVEAAWRDLAALPRL